jgi:hypothetical protein
MSQKRTVSPKLAAGLFIAAGVMWCVAGWMGGQAAFYAIGALFVILGLANLARARKAGGA